MRANDFTNKVYYTLIINGVAKVTKKDYLALERLAKDYKKAHPKDKIKIVHSQDLPEGFMTLIKYPADRSLEETDSTGMGGGSAGIGGGSMVGGPETYEEEFGPFKRKGKFKRTTAMTY